VGVKQQPVLLLEGWKSDQILKQNRSSLDKDHDDNNCWHTYSLVDYLLPRNGINTCPQILLCVFVFTLGIFLLRYEFEFLIYQ